MSDELSMYAEKSRKSTERKTRDPSVNVSNNLVKLDIQGKTYNLPSIEMFQRLEKLVKQQANEINRLQFELNQVRSQNNSRPVARPSNRPESPF